MTILMAVLLRAFVSPRLSHMLVSTHRSRTPVTIPKQLAKLSWRRRLTSVSAWSDVAHNFRGDWQML